MTRKDVLKAFAKGALATILFVAGGEGILRVAFFARNSMVSHVPLPYVIGDDYGPMPPWFDEVRILEPDENLLWRSRPNLHRTYVDVFSPARTEEERTSLLARFRPTVPDSLKDNPVWEIWLNSDGFRNAEFPNGKSPSAFRIVCLGDSWTFGANVGQDQAYPQRLQAFLDGAFPGAGFEVLNLGVLGYSSYQGLELLKRRALSLAPDLVVIAFAMNDAKVAGYRDKDIPANRRPPTILQRLGGVVQQSEFYQLLRYFALRVKERPKSIGDYVTAMAETSGTQAEVWGGGEVNEVTDYTALEPWTRVSPPDFEHNVREMIRLARARGAGVILVRNELWNTPYGAVLEKVSAAERVPLVDSYRLVAAARRRVEADVEARLDLRPPPAGGRRTDGDVDVIVRVYAGRYLVPDALYIAGAHPALGDVVPNTVRMYDDGSHGDQRAGDGVWSYAAAFPIGTRLFCVYTNSGTPGRWEGLDVPHVRSFTVRPADGGPVYRPIETFGRMYLQADGWHTDARGYDLIARALMRALEQDAHVRAHLTRRAASRPPAAPP